MSQDEHFIRKGETVSLDGQDTIIHVRKIFTPAGERLEIEAPDRGYRIRLDAMELESLSWQDHETFVEFLASGDALPEGFETSAPSPDEEVDVVHEWSVTNEFADARVRKLSRSDGEWLEIEAPKLGYVIRLDPLELAGVTWQETETFTAFLETPFGPDDH
jgi:hypothetical protein